MLSGVGVSELVLLFIIGLLILGPERLPKVASQIGRWVGKARRTANQLRFQMEREIALAEIDRTQKKDQDKNDDRAGAGSGRPSDDAAKATDEASDAEDTAGADRKAGGEPPEHAAATPGPDATAQGDVTPLTEAGTDEKQ